MTSRTHTTSCVAKAALILTALLPAIAAAASPPALSHQDPVWLFQHGIPLERVEDAPFVSPLGTTGATRAARIIGFRRFTLIQVKLPRVGAATRRQARNVP